MPERIVVLPGDGIGPEVAAEAVRVLESLPLDVEIHTHPFGGAAIDAGGEPLPAETLAACRRASAVLLGAVGGPQWDGGGVRPEQGLIKVRTTTFNQDGKAVQILVSNLVVPRRQIQHAAGVDAR